METTVTAYPQQLLPSRNVAEGPLQNDNGARLRTSYVVIARLLRLFIGADQLFKLALRLDIDPLKLRGQDWRAANTLSLSGIYQPRKDGSIRFPAALEQYLKDNPCVERIVLCLDNDEPGRAASAAIQKELSEYEVIDNPPRSGKDYNDQLQLMKGICGRVRTRGGTAR